MRFAGVFLAVSIAVAVASMTGPAQQAAAQTENNTIRLAEAKKKAAPKAKTEPKGNAKKGDAKQGDTKQGKSEPRPAAYATMPRTERAALQYDLAWTGHYTGTIDGDFTERSVTAVRAFQTDRGFKLSGVLQPAERTALADSSTARQDRVGWQFVEDRETGAQLGVPTKLAPRQSKGKRGTHWQSAQGQVQIETWRIREPGTTIANVFEDQKREPQSRRLDYSLLRGDNFVLSGLQGLKKFYVRADVRDFEVRGITILYDQAVEGTMDSVAVVMASAFSPFSGTGLAELIGLPTRRKIEYGTGIVVSAAGYVISDRLLTEGCNVIEIAGHGDVNRVADHAGGGIALLRVFGGAGLTPAALVHEGATASNLTLVGIADPQMQAGLRTISTATARLNGDGIAPPPQLGFAGAAALDGRGRFYGMVTLKAPAFATDNLPDATVATVNEIRKFLDAQYVTPATGNAGVDAAKNSVVRVICVRR
jgi:peptidoglycan hydrolase-like protein with peptidoglycan-binding domain